MRARICRIAVSALACLLLAGCAGTVELSAGEVNTRTESVAMVVTPEDLAALDALTELKSADFSGSDCYAEILAWGEAHPEVELRYTVRLPDGREVASGAENLDLSSLSSSQRGQVPELLEYLPALRTVKLTDGEVMSPLQLQKFVEARPDVSYDYTLPLLGETVGPGTRALSFIGHGDRDARKLEALLPYLPALERVDLGGEEDGGALSWSSIAALQKLRPDVDFSYTFTLYDREFSTLDERMDFSHVKMHDEGRAVWQVLPCMQKLNYLDMDSCGIDNETMAGIRDQYPDVTVVWRVWFGTSYNARTDAIKILASNPGIGGNLMPGTYENLKYFTKLKYLDVGHQPMLDDISFISYMPDLEVAILCMGCWTDPSPIADCPHLEFLEIQTSLISDLTPLSGLKELRHLNIGYDFYLTDISPIYDLDLERLWIGSLTPIPAEQVEEYQRRHPDCVVNTEGADPHYMWRWIGYDKQGNPVRDPRYDLLVDQMGYDLEEYAFEWKENLR